MRRQEGQSSKVRNLASRVEGFPGEDESQRLINL